MATYRKRGSSWQAAVHVNGVRDSATRKTKAEAVAWATGREAELTGKRLPDHTVGDALERFGRDVSPGRKGAKWELLRIGAFSRDPLASVRLPSLSAQDLASWRDRRLKSVAAGSVRREFNVLRAALRVARLEWGWLREDVCSAVKCLLRHRRESGAFQTTKSSGSARCLGSVLDWSLRRPKTA